MSVRVHKILSNVYLRILIFTALTIVLAVLFYIIPYQSFYLEYFFLTLTLLISSIVIESLRKKSKWYLFGFSFDRFALKDSVIGFLIPTLYFTIILTLHFILGNEIVFNNIDLNLFIINAFIFLNVAIYEELLFRGIIFQALIDRFNSIVIIIGLSLFFSLFHFLNPNMTIISAVNIFLAGVFLSVSYLRSRSLWLPISFHFFWNFLSFFMIGSPVSGIPFGGSLFSISQADNITNILLFGDEFGIESSYLTSALLLFSILIVIKYVTISPYISSKLFIRKYEESKLKQWRKK